MEVVNEPTIKSEKEDQVWTGSEYKREGTQSGVNLSENVIYIKDSLQIKDGLEKIPGCIKEEIKDEVEIGFEEWKEFETDERDCSPGCVKGDLTEISQISLTHTVLPEVFQKIKLETEGDAEFNELPLESSLDATEGKNIKPEEENGSQVRSGHRPSTGLSSERIFRKKFGCGKEPVVRLVRIRPENIIPLHRNLRNFEEPEEILRRKFGCEREAMVELARVSLKATVPMEEINSKGGMENITKEAVMLDSMAKSEGLNIVEGPANHFKGKGGSTSLTESFSGGDIFVKSAETFDGNNVNQHSLLNMRERQYTYSHCSFVANNADVLKISYSTQNKEKKFACDHCSFKTNYKSSLNVHRLNHGNMKKYACDQCSYKTNDKSNLIQHCLNHMDINIFACNQCSYKTNYRSCFTEHCQNHSNIKNFACDQCSYKTNFRSRLSQHCINHSSIKKFACSECLYKTNNKSHLIRHLRNHNNIKKFACDQCSYKTDEKTHLTRHCRNHSGTKKFACDHCSYKTDSKSHLSRHCMNHNNIKKFTCDLCSFKTIYKRNFIQHCRIHKNKKAHNEII